MVSIVLLITTVLICIGLKALLAGLIFGAVFLAPPLISCTLGFRCKHLETEQARRNIYKRTSFELVRVLNKIINVWATEHTHYPSDLSETFTSLVSTLSPRSQNSLFYTQWSLIGVVWKEPDTKKQCFPEVEDFIAERKHTHTHTHIHCTALKAHQNV